jgi:hypothetical protein
MNEVYLGLVLSSIEEALLAAKALGDIDNPGLKGSLRETVIEKLLIPLFPADVGIGSGVIVTADGRQSREQDVIIYDKRILPPLILGRSAGLFPIESALYTVEIKSTLSVAELEKSHTSASELLDFSYATGEYRFDQAGGMDVAVEHGLTRAISTLLAFKSDLKGTKKTEHARYDEVRAPDALPAIRALCVVDASYCYWNDVSGWVSGPTNGKPHEELVGFLAGIMNKYRGVAASRREPRLGSYLF